jgi:hypothetical protein
MTAASMNKNTGTSSSGAIPFYVLRLGNATLAASNDDAQSDIIDPLKDMAITDSSTSSSISSLCRTKALFTVPAHLATALIVHPIVCCGSLFYLSFDDVDVAKSSCSTSTTITTTTTTTTATTQQHPPNTNFNQPKKENTSTTVKTTFLSTTYESIDPDMTAYEIAKRITIRIQNVRNTISVQSQSKMNGNDTNANKKNGEMLNEETAFVTKHNDWAAQMLF